MKKLSLVVLSLAIVVLVSGCTTQTDQQQKPTSTSTVNPTQTVIATPTTPIVTSPQTSPTPVQNNAVSDYPKSPKDVVNQYLNSYASSTNYQEGISTGEASLTFTTEPLKGIILARLDFYKKDKQNFDSFISDYSILCIGVLPKDVCNKDVETSRQQYEASYIYKHTIKSIKEIKNQNNLASVEVERDIVTPFNRTYETITYNLKIINDEWKISDRSGADSLEETIKQFDESLQQMQKTYRDQLNRLSKMKSDKCGYLLSNTALTQTELEREQYTCYNGQYINNAVLKKDVTVCNEISLDAQFALCYGAVAAEMKSISICDNIEDRKYQAKAFYDPLSTNDVCYFNYVTVLLTKNTLPRTDLTTACNFIVNGQLKQQCLSAVGQ